MQALEVKLQPAINSLFSEKYKTHTHTHMMGAYFAVLVTINTANNDKGGHVSGGGKPLGFWGFDSCLL